MDVFQALFLGLLQGLTEFLPISSSAHLILTPALFGWTDQGVGFDLSVHVGTLLAVVLYFRRDVFGIARDGLISVSRRKIVGQGALAWYLVIGTIPAGLAGLALLDMIDNELRAVEVIFFTTLFFGLLLGLADWLPKRQRTLDKLNWKDAVLVGIAQAMALVPGTSRSGVTITAGLFLLIYATGRTIVENFRLPDSFVEGLPDWITMGQLLSIPMWIGGAWLVWNALKTKPVAAD